MTYKTDIKELRSDNERLRKLLGKTLNELVRLNKEKQK